MPGRILGLYALSVMDREGGLYGYALADRIAQRTGGAWRPGPGAIYPALESLTRRHLARADRIGRRRIYDVTPQGRTFLRHLRRQMAGRMRAGPELGLLWSEIAGHEDPGAFLLERLTLHLDRIADYLSRSDPTPARREALRSEVLRELERARGRLTVTENPVPAHRGRSRRPGP